MCSAQKITVPNAFTSVAYVHYAEQQRPHNTRRLEESWFCGGFLWHHQACPCRREGSYWCPKDNSWGILCSNAVFFTYCLVVSSIFMMWDEDEISCHVLKGPYTKSHLEYSRTFFQHILVSRPVHLFYFLVLYSQVGKLYTYVPRSAIEKFVELCMTCHSRKAQMTRAPLRPIISSGFMTRCQVQIVVCAVECSICALCSRPNQHLFCQHTVS